MGLDRTNYLTFFSKIIELFKYIQLNFQYDKTSSNYLDSIKKH